MGACCDVSSPLSWPRGSILAPVFSLGKVLAAKARSSVNPAAVGHRTPVGREMSDVSCKNLLPGSTRPDPYRLLSCPLAAFAIWPISCLFGPREGSLVHQLLDLARETTALKSEPSRIRQEAEGLQRLLSEVTYTLRHRQIIPSNARGIRCSGALPNHHRPSQRLFFFPDRSNWPVLAGRMCLNVVPTGPREMPVYLEHPGRILRYTLRTDGLVASAQPPGTSSHDPPHLPPRRSR